MKDYERFIYIYIYLYTYVYVCTSCILYLWPLCLFSCCTIRTLAMASVQLFKNAHHGLPGPYSKHQRKISILLSCILVYSSLLNSMVLYPIPHNSTNEIEFLRRWWLDSLGFPHSVRFVAGLGYLGVSFFSCHVHRLSFWFRSAAWTRSKAHGM